MVEYPKETLYYRYNKLYKGRIYLDIALETNYPCFLDELTSSLGFNGLILKYARTIYHALFLNGLPYKPIYNKSDINEEIENLSQNGEFVYYNTPGNVKSAIISTNHQIRITCSYFISSVQFMHEYLMITKENPLYQILTIEEINAILTRNPNYTSVYAKKVEERIKSTNLYYDFYRDISNFKNKVCLPRKALLIEDLLKEEESKKLVRDSKTYLDYLDD